MKLLLILLLVLNFAYSQCSGLGDINDDYNVDILDVIYLINIILDENNVPDNLIYICDINSDSNIDIFDSVLLVNVILNCINPCSDDITLSEGENFVRYYCDYSMSLDTISEYYIHTIATEGQASTFHPDLGWFGSLLYLEPNHYYWFVVQGLPYEPYPFDFSCPEDSVRIEIEN